MSDIFLGSLHVSLVGLGSASDDDVWAFALANAYVIVTKDADFSDYGVVRGYPPKVVWLRLGNCTTRQIESVVRGNQKAIEKMVSDPALGILTLF
jgi:predicted nuclease of predicted toxin-antitoxin system